MIHKPQQGLQSFLIGEEVKRLGFSRPEESFYEVIDPENSLARSLVTGEEVNLEGSYFLSINQANDLPEPIDLELAKESDVYIHAHTGIHYQVAQKQKDLDTLNLINLESGEQSLFPRFGLAQFYKND